MRDVDGMEKGERDGGEMCVRERWDERERWEREREMQRGIYRDR